VTLLMEMALLFYIQVIFVPNRKHAYGPPRPVKGIALLLYMQMMCVPHRKQTYGPPRPVTGIALLFLYLGDIRTDRLCGLVVRVPGC
jgi:hypothetical protein